MAPRYSLGAILDRMGACSDARHWLRDAAHPDGASAWAAMPRGDHLLWLAAMAGVDRRLVVLAACDCAESALVHVPAGEDRPRLAIETARRWARGEATFDEVRKAAYAAHAADHAHAAYAAYAAAAANAAYAAANAAYAAANAAAAAANAAAANANAAYAAAAANAAHAAHAAAYAAAAANAAYDGSLAHSADLVRVRIPYATVESALIDYARREGCLVEIARVS